MRTPRSRRVLLGAALSLVMVLGGCTRPPSVDLAKCPERTGSQIRVVVVVDPTTLTGSGPSVVCVVLPAGSDGLDALNARAQRAGRAAPRLGESGLLCAIDSQPAAPACGELGPDGYEYWGYYVGGASWSFAVAGPASHVLEDGAVEGWAFQRGTADGQPRTASSFASLAR